MSIGLAALHDPRIHALAATDLFALQAAGQTRHRIDWALEVLDIALPGVGWDILCTLPLGRRDALLLAVRGKSFGRALSFFAECPDCGERVEFAMDLCDLIIADPFDALPGPGSGALDSVAIAQALADAGPAGHDVASLAAALRARVPDAPPHVQDKALQEADPMVVLSFPMQCPACAGHWSPLLDVVQMLWSDIQEQTRRALSDVHALAQAYGWDEATILALGPERRSAYIDLIHR